MRKIGAAVLLLCAYMLCVRGSAEALYRFDDVFSKNAPQNGASGVGAQWVAVTIGGDSGGASTVVSMDTEANFINDRDSAYLTNGFGKSGLTKEPIHTLFLVLPEGEGHFRVSFDYYQRNDADSTQDVVVGNSLGAFYKIEKTSNGTNNTDQLYDIRFSNGPSDYRTVRGNFIFHQNPKNAPSQTLEVPFIIANVYNGMAEDSVNGTRAYLRINSTMRDTNVAASYGNIVARDKFKWGVANDYDPDSLSNKYFVPDSFKDWVFVPIQQVPIDSNGPINYSLQTDVANYSGIRYALQRYDGKAPYSPMSPTRWAFDIPDAPDVSKYPHFLDDLSHMPPGLVTTYRQQFNVVKGVKEAMYVYPVDPYQDFRTMTISHRSVFGLDFGAVSDTTSKVASYTVNGFKFLPANIQEDHFLKDVGAIMGVKDVKQQEPPFSMPSAVQYKYVASDVVNSFELSAAVPSKLGPNGLLPIHVTLNLSKDNQIVSRVWTELLNSSRNSDGGDIRDIFSDYFSVFLRSGTGFNLDLIKWLKEESKDADAYRKTVKVFMDEQRNVITVHFIVMMLDGGTRPVVRLVNDTVDATPTDNSYTLIRDGNENGRWDMTFFTAPKEYAPTDGSGSSRSGGGDGGGSSGCSAGVGGLLTLAAIFLAPALLKRR
ncbi:hypothetical protein AGMMS49957_14740 [Synergistales bacterium]|nr:hypothetical protein AGMMS49957_14740 [Synergistales bacterium]